jgi:hypothetical protein
VRHRFKQKHSMFSGVDGKRQREHIIPEHTNAVTALPKLGLPLICALSTGLPV